MQPRGKNEKTKKNLVADAVTVEPVFASRFPATREFCREFLEIRRFGHSGIAEQGRSIGTFEPNSLRSITGNYFIEAGILAARAASAKMHHQSPGSNI